MEKTLWWTPPYPSARFSSYQDFALFEVFSEVFKSKFQLLSSFCFCISRCETLKNTHLFSQKHNAMVTQRGHLWWGSSNSLLLTRHSRWWCQAWWKGACYKSRFEQGLHLTCGCSVFLGLSICKLSFLLLYFMILICWRSKLSCSLGWFCHFLIVSFTTLGCPLFPVNWK